MGLRDLPEGPVTLMFTDIEGSTALRTTLGDAETDALFHEHDELIRQQIEAHQGRDRKAALGDGFLGVFVSTRRASTMRSCAGGNSRRPRVWHPREFEIRDPCECNDRCSSRPFAARSLQMHGTREANLRARCGRAEGVRQ
jgi:class 3 adenylate cyclase